MTTTTGQARYRVDGMDCGACATKVDTAVRRLPGVEDLAVSAATGVMSVRHTPDLDQNRLERTVTGLGYRISPLDDAARATVAGGPRTKRRWWRAPKVIVLGAMVAALLAAFVLRMTVPAFGPWPFVLAMLIGLVPIAGRALAAARSGTPFSIEMLMTIAAVGAVFIDASEEAGIFVLLFLAGEMLEGMAAARARASIQSLIQLVPKTALIEADGGTRVAPAESLRIGDRILVRPGDRIPADGQIVAGEGEIDESPVTGESTPVRKGLDDRVFAGTLNGDAALHVRVTAEAADNTIARVVQLVEEAQESKAPTERFIDRFSRYYTPGVLVVAALTAIAPPMLADAAWRPWIYKGLAILLIGCPCALVISTPAAIAASLAAGARRGLLLKGGVVLETLRKVTVVAFDKTGTLTLGAPQVTDVVGFGRTETEVVRHAAALEAGSSHPLGRAILACAATRGLAIPPAVSAKALNGKGVTGAIDGVSVFLGSLRAAGELAAVSPQQRGRIADLSQQGKTVAILVADGVLAGVIAMRDEPRPDAKAGLQALARAGVRTLMLTGDNPRTAEAVGKALGVEARAELLPQDKLKIVNTLKAEGAVVAKVGDGINDAPALAAADVGIAMGAGTDVALEAASAASLNNRITDVAAMIALSRRTMRNIAQNITLALSLKAMFLVTTLAGLTGLWPAILADTGATVLVTLNALRLLGPPLAASPRPKGRLRLGPTPAVQSP